MNNVVRMNDDSNSSTTKIPSVICLDLCKISSRGFICRYCQISFASLSDLKVHEDVLEKPIKCTICDEYFTSKIGMKKHYGKVHAKYRPSRCNLCKKRFRNKYAAKRHNLQVHQALSRTTCKNCGKVLYNKFSLSRHSQICG